MNQRVAISSLGIQTQGLVVSSILSKPGAGPLFERSSSASTLSTLYSRVKIRCSGGCSCLRSSAMVSYSSPMAAACEDGENQPSLCEVYHLLAALPSKSSPVCCPYGVLAWELCKVRIRSYSMNRDCSSRLMVSQSYLGLELLLSAVHPAVGSSIISSL